MDFDFGGKTSLYETNLATFQISRMEQYGNATALVDAKTGRFYTYADIINRVQCLAAGLGDLGLRKGDVLCILTYNHIDYHVIWYAVCMLGGTLQTAAPSYTDDDLCWRFKECGTKFLVTTPNQINGLTKMLNKNRNKDSQSMSGLENLKHIIVYGGDMEGYVSFESLLSRGRLTEPVAIDPERDIAILLTSSGTTGLPKHVMLTHRNIIANIPQMLETIQHQTGMCAAVCLAMFHHYGVQSCVNTGLYNGLKMVVMERFNLEHLLYLIMKYKIQVLQVVPPMLLQIVKHKRLHDYDLTSVTCVASGAAPLGVELEKKVKQVFGLNVCINDDVFAGYGTTEAGHMVGNGPAGYKEGSVGVPPRGVKIKIVDIETGRPVQPNEAGEIRVGGPQVFIGYLNQVEYSKTCFDDEGYFKTGDLGYIDSDGFLYFKERIKELIKYKATQVAPAYLEDVLKKHPDIADAAVVGVPDEEAGELPKAFVVRQPGSKLTESEVHKHVNDHVASYMKLRGGVTFIDSIPRTPSGKILRRILKQKTLIHKL